MTISHKNLQEVLLIQLNLINYNEIKEIVQGNVKKKIIGILNIKGREETITWEIIEIPEIIEILVIQEIHEIIENIDKIESVIEAGSEKTDIVVTEETAEITLKNVRKKGKLRDKLLIGSITFNQITPICRTIVLIV